MVWSIVNLICCCMPLGIAGLVFTLTAKSEMNVEGREKKLRTAAILNIVGTVVGLLICVFSFFTGLLL